MKDLENLYQKYIELDKKTGDPVREYELNTVHSPRARICLAFDQEIGPEEINAGQRSSRVTTELQLSHAAKMFDALNTMNRSQAIYMRDETANAGRLQEMGIQIAKKLGDECILEVPNNLMKEIAERGFCMPEEYKGPLALWTGTPEETEAALQMTRLHSETRTYSIFSKSTGTQTDVIKHMRDISDAIEYVQEERILETLSSSLN